ncbi:hypothetical protein JVU11DRAFT_4123 [Chiua virens]|nr:hypothetical protein JVU11DRAFT_4123 [Chiua virens]
MSETTWQSRKRKYRSDGPTPTWVKRAIDGPGVWASCVKGKEKQTVGELYDLFESLASELWPVEGRVPSEGRHASEDEDEGDDVEVLVQRELASIKRPRIENRLDKYPLRCVHLLQAAGRSSQVDRHACRERSKDGGGANEVYAQTCTCIWHLRRESSQRYILCVDVCLHRSLQEADSPKGTPQVHKYKIELRVRNHNTLTRMGIIEEIAKCMPANYVVDLDHPDVFILVEVFKSVCGVSILRDYYKLHKFNVMTLANEKNTVEDFKPDAGRVRSRELSGTDSSPTEHSQAQAQEGDA